MFCFIFYEAGTKNKYKSMEVTLPLIPFRIIMFTIIVSKKDLTFDDRPYTFTQETCFLK